MNAVKVFFNVLQRDTCCLEWRRRVVLAAITTAPQLVGNGDGLPTVF